MFLIRQETQPPSTLSICHSSSFRDRCVSKIRFLIVCSVRSCWARKMFRAFSRHTNSDSRIAYVSSSSLSASNLICFVCSSQPPYVHELHQQKRNSKCAKNLLEPITHFLGTRCESGLNVIFAQNLFNPNCLTSNSCASVLLAISSPTLNCTSAKRFNFSHAV